MQTRKYICLGVTDAMQGLRLHTRNGGISSFLQSGKVPENRFFGERKMPLRCLPDVFMMLTFFDAVVIAIATCSYRDSNMMLST